MASFIGPNKIKSHEDVKGDIPLVKVTYDNGNVEQLSKLMYDEVASEEKCDLTELREKRVSPAVAQILEIIRDWGLKVNELPYMDALLKTSLEENAKAAQNELWSKWMPEPNDPGEVDFITIDRVLLSKKVALKDVINE